MKKEKKVAKVMREFKKGKLHSGSKKGPKVKSRKQAIAIALSEAGMARRRNGKSWWTKTNVKRKAKNS